MNEYPLHLRRGGSWALVPPLFIKKRLPFGHRSGCYRMAQGRPVRLGLTKTAGSSFPARFISRSIAASVGGSRIGSVKRSMERKPKKTM